MTELRVDTITDAAGTGKPDFEDSITIDGSTLANTNTAEYNSSSEEPTSPKNGSIWWDSTNEKVYIYANSEFKEVTLQGDDTVAASFYGDRAVLTGGTIGSGNQNVIQYFPLATATNATDFGDLTDVSTNGTSHAGGGVGIFAGGTGTNPGNIDRFTISTLGNATNHGTLSGGSSAGHQQLCSFTDSIYGVFAGGYNSSYLNVLQYITIATTGNTTDFGDLTQTVIAADGISNATYGLRTGGLTSAVTNVIDYVTIATPGNATDFGDMTGSFSRHACTEDDTRGMMLGGQLSGTHSNVMQYVTIATTGNATDFGDLAVSVYFRPAGVSDGTYGAACGGSGASGRVDNIQRFTIQTLGNATDHADLLAATETISGCSGASS